MRVERLVFGIFAQEKFGKEDRERPNPFAIDESKHVLQWALVLPTPDICDLPPFQRGPKSRVANASF
jgi:hypothetical protein